MPALARGARPPTRPPAGLPGVETRLAFEARALRQPGPQMREELPGTPRRGWRHPRVLSPLSRRLRLWSKRESGLSGATRRRLEARPNPSAHPVVTPSGQWRASCVIRGTH